MPKRSLVPALAVAASLLVAGSADRSAALTPTQAPMPPVWSATAAPAVLVALPATRIYEALVPASAIPAASTVVVSLADRVPVGATAVVLNVSRATAASMPMGLCTDPAAGGCTGSASSGTTPGDPGTSMLATLALGSERTLKLSLLYTSAVAVDLLGYYVDAGATPTAGRFRPAEPQRLFDTRVAGGGGPVEDASVTVSVAGLVPPDTGAVLAVVQLVEVERDSVAVAHPTGTPVPYATNLLAIAPMRTIGNLVLVPVSDGRFDVHVSGRAQVVVDLVGSYTSDASAPGSDGRYVPLRENVPLDAVAPGGVDPLTRMFRRGVVARAAVPTPVGGPPVGALVLQLSAWTLEPGYVTLWGSGPVPWATSLINALERHATETVVPVRNGAFSVIASVDAQLSLHASGYFTGS